MNKKTIAAMFGVETYEDENNKLTSDLLTLQKSYELTREANIVLANRVIELEDKLEKMKDVDVYIDEEVASRMEAYKKKCNDDLRHKWLAAGRMDAYNEMGIRALESRQAGTTMYYIKDTGEVIEDITKDLEDVPVIDLGTVNIPVDAPDEIEIEDLV